jgi:REP element-mobilizing transposase RayT
MAVSVLIMTPIRSFGELLQQALQETGNFKATLVHSSENAIQQNTAYKFPVAVLDFDVDPNPSQLVSALRSVTPEIRIVAIKYEAEGQTSIAEELSLKACLDAPFYLPDLLDAMRDVLVDLGGPAFQQDEDEHVPFPSGVVQKKITSQSEDVPEWLQDVSRAAQHLTRLSLETAAQAALITRGNQLWAYAGELPQVAAEELARTVGHYWSRDGGSDLARFIRLEMTGGEFMLYATGLGGDYVLALAFKTEMPFSEIRAQAGGLARRLAMPPQEIPDLAEIPSTVEKTDPLPLDDGFWEEDDYAFPDDWRPDQEFSEGRQAFFEDLLSTIDVPEPNGIQIPQDGAISESPEIAVDEDSRDDPQADTKPSRPVTPRETGDETRRTPIVSPFADHLAETQKISITQPSPSHLVETHPTPVREQRGRKRPSQETSKGLEAPTPTLHNLMYACVLIPRLPQHHLLGDLALRLNQWVMQLSITFGWRLEHLAIRPGFLHWMAVVQPATSTAAMVRNLRQQTSQRIFREFPWMAWENPSQDFWAPGYLIVNGRDPLSQQLVQEFITKTRVHQGAHRQQPDQEN